MWGSPAPTGRRRGAGGVWGVPRAAAAAGACEECAPPSGSGSGGVISKEAA